MKNVLKLLILSDIFLITGFGLVNPIMAIFIKDNLVGGTIAAVGIASALFMVVKSVLQIFIAKRFSAKDRLWLLWTGTFFVAFVPFLYAYSTSIYHIYLAQIFHAMGAAMAAPAFMGLYILHTDRKKPGLEWTWYSTSASLGTGLAAYLGAILATIIGFKAVFFITGALSLIGALILIRLSKEKLAKK